MRKYDYETGRFTSTDALWEKYRSFTPYNYCGNNPICIVDPMGKDWWEKVVNLATGKGWRDDTMQENYDQRDWENLTPQLADEAGIDRTKINVEYSPIMTVEGQGPAHYTDYPDGQKPTIVMTKGGYENVDKSNINNSRNSIQHEKQHAQDALDGKLKRSSSPKEEAEADIRAINYQQSHPTWKATDEKYKNGVNGTKYQKIQEVKFYESQK